MEVLLTEDESKKMPEKWIYFSLRYRHKYLKLDEVKGKCGVGRRRFTRPRAQFAAGHEKDV